MKLTKPLSFAAAVLLSTALAPVAAHQNAAPPADEVARTVEAIAGIRAAFSPSFSPDGRSLAYISNASGRPQLWVMRLDGSGEPVQLTHGEDPVQPVYWSPDGAWLAYAVAPGGGLNSSTWRVPTAAARGASRPGAATTTGCSAGPPTAGA